MEINKGVICCIELTPYVYFLGKKKNQQKWTFLKEKQMHLEECEDEQ